MAASNLSHLFAPLQPAPQRPGSSARAAVKIAEGGFYLYVGLFLSCAL